MSNFGSLPGMARSDFNVRDARATILELLQTYGKLSYSRLQVMTRLEAPTLDAALSLLLGEGTIRRSGSDYELATGLRALFG